MGRRERGRGEEGSQGGMEGSGDHVCMYSQQMGADKFQQQKASH